MKTRGLFLCVLILGCSHAQIPLPRLAATDASASRGEYIVRTVAVCGGCHGDHLSGGREFRDWRIGVARASNLTPDPETGLGNWSEAEIVRALRNGVRKDGRLLAPVMPYEWFHEMSDSDALAVARYLRSLPAVRNPVTQNPNFIFKAGRALFLHPLSGTTVPEPANRGAYLTQHAGLCADCHTQRTGLLQKPDKTRLFGGMTKPPKDFPVKPPNITPDPTRGIGKWSEADFDKAMRTGVRPDGRKLDPFMPWPAFAKLTDEDLHAMWEYLRTVKPVH